MPEDTTFPRFVPEPRDFKNDPPCARLQESPDEEGRFYDAGEIRRFHRQLGEIVDEEKIVREADAECFAGGDLREAIGVALRDWRTADRGGTTPEVTIKEILLLGTVWCNTPKAEEEIDRLTDTIAAAVEPLVQQPALEPEEDAGLRLLSVSGPDATRRRYVLGAKPEPRAPVPSEGGKAAAEALIWNRLEDAAIHLLDEASLPVRVILAGDGRLFDLAHEIARSLEDLTAQGENGEERAEGEAETGGINREWKLRRLVGRTSRLLARVAQLEAEVDKLRAQVERIPGQVVE